MHHLVVSTSDHCALLITDAKGAQKSSNRRRFQFEAIWTRRDDCKDIIQEVWNGSQEINSPMGIVARLSCCAKKLTIWNNMVFGQISKRI